MKDMRALVLGLLTVFAATSAQAQALKSDDEKTLYALGASIGQSLSTFSLTPAELDLVKRGLTDSVTNQKLQVDLGAFQPKIQELARKRGEAAQKKSEAAAPAEKQKGKEY